MLRPKKRRRRREVEALDQRAFTSASLGEHRKPSLLGNISPTADLHSSASVVQLTRVFVSFTYVIFKIDEFKVPIVSFFDDLEDIKIRNI